jgi:2-keto-3-deoxy-L-rhamnonate aldolase RhmA
MRRSKVLAKLRSGKHAHICATGHFLPFYVRHAAHNGYDGIWFDLEHRTLDEREVQAFIALCHLNDIDCMVRPKTMQRSELYHYLEDGAAGFMVPFVSTPQYAADLVSALKFPPLGNRGVDGAGLDGGYGLDVWKPDTTYFADANRETFIVAQIETPEAVRNAEAIAAVPGIDLLFVGPADLGRRLAVAEGADRMTLDEAFAAVASAAKRHGKAWGTTAGSLSELEARLKMGAQMVPWGGDFALAAVLAKCGQELNRLDSAARREDGWPPED